MHVAGLILAAGGSSRMMKTKQLLPWGESTMLQQAIQTARKSKITSLYLVLGSDASRIQQQADLEGITVVQNKQWQDGLGRSIAVSVKKIAKEPLVDACLILLADQPFITPDYLNTMIGGHDANMIIASSYKGRAGVPCLFPRRFFHELEGLQGDRGAGHLLQELGSFVRVLEVPADLRDIDTPETYRKFHPR